MVYLYGAIDKQNAVLYIIGEYYNDQNEFNQHVAEYRNSFKKFITDPGADLAFMPVADPAGINKTAGDISYFKLFNEKGIYFQEANTRKKLAPTIARVSDYINLGHVKIFKSCKHTIAEGVDYRYEPQELGAEKNAKEEPIDYKNHAMDALRFIISRLPDKPSDLSYITVDR
jgi:hypothetical protein